MHADHIMGIVPLLRNILFPPPAENFPYALQSNSTPKIELYGPAGLRLFVRQVMKMTLTRTSDKYVVHELLTAEDAITPCNHPNSVSWSNSTISEPAVMHSSEVAGLNIRSSPEDGLWRAVTYGKGTMSEIIVDVGPVLHRDPCVGYVFSEIQYPSRKLVLLGDTYDPSPIIPLCLNPSPSLLVHEATDSHISREADPSGKLSRRSADEVLKMALARGHSVPDMAGAFAKKIDAQQLVLNHIGGRFPAPRKPADPARDLVMRDIEKKANEAWGPGKSAIAAWDFMRVHVPFHAASSGSALSNVTREIEAFRSGQTSIMQNKRVDSSKESSYNRNGKRGR